MGGWQNVNECKLGLGGWSWWCKWWWWWCTRRLVVVDQDQKLLLGIVFTWMNISRRWNCTECKWYDDDDFSADVIFKLGRVKFQEVYKGKFILCWVFGGWVADERGEFEKVCSFILKQQGPEQWTHSRTNKHRHFYRCNHFNHHKHKKSGTFHMQMLDLHAWSWVFGDFIPNYILK